MPLYVYLDLASVLLYIHIYYRSKGFFHVLSFYENKVLVESKTFYHILHNLINKNKCVQSPCDLHQGHGHIYLSTNFLRDQSPMPKLELVTEAQMKREVAALIGREGRKRREKGR